MAITVDEGQCLNDVTIQYAGDVEAVFAVGMLNDVSVTDTPTPGSKLLMVDPVNKEVVKYFSDNNKVPATVGLDAITPLGGIGYMQIGNDFKVS